MNMTGKCFLGGIILSELDKVTTVKVYNWFANRRKDDKRRRHIGMSNVIVSGCQAPEELPNFSS